MRTDEQVAPSMCEKCQGEREAFDEVACAWLPCPDCTTDEQAGE